MPAHDPRPAFVPDWPTCTRAPKCLGAVVRSGSCLAHIGSELEPYLESLRRGHHVDVRGTVFSARLLEQLVDAMRDGQGNGAVRFDNVVFADTARFDHVRFADQVDFCGAIFRKVDFRGAIFRKGGHFDGAQFGGAAMFRDVHADGELSYVNTLFKSRSWLGPMAADRLILRRARFAKRAEVDVAADVVDCNLARFEEGVIVRAHRAVINLKEAAMGPATLIAGSPGQEEASVADWMPRILFLRATDVSNLELADVDLSWCEFAGAHRLDQIRFTGHCVLDSPPKGWWRTRRQTIAEERVVRGWRPATTDVVRAERVAGLYRSLRKAFEDSKNEAGAGDFYYGEMEMRRHSAETRRAERWILFVYWLLSGYGQRAARAIAALLVLIAIVGILLALWGQPTAEAVQIAVGAVVLREPGAELTEAGQWTVLVARVLGPLLLALAVLAVRARVKR